jgi:hypothetical protein
MYGDKLLEMQQRSQTAAETTGAVCLGQNNLAGDTRGVAPVESLYLLVIAGEDVPATVVFTLQTSDTAGGTYVDLVSKTTAAVVPAGKVAWKEMIPHNARNWLRVKTTGTAAAPATYYKIDAILVHNADKDLYGLGGVDG